MLTAARAAAPAAAVAAVAAVAPTVHRPTVLELAADPKDLAVIRDLYGSRAQTIINALLSFDGFFSWYFNLKKSVDHDAELSVKEAHALENCRRAIDMNEMYERCSIGKHGSFMPHGAIFKTTRDILSSRSETSGAIASQLWSCRMQRRSVLRSRAAAVASRCRPPE